MADNNIDKPVINVLIVEDDRDFAAAIRDLLALAFPNSSVMTEIVSTVQAATACLVCPVPCYDVVLLDLTLPDSSGIATVDSIATLPTATPIVVLTNLQDPALVAASLRHGVEEFLPKSVLTTCGKAATVLRRVIMHALHRHTGHQRAYLSLARLYGGLSDPTPTPSGGYKLDHIKGDDK